MGEVRDLIGAEGAAAASVVGPAKDAGFEEGAIQDQLRAALKQIEQSDFAVGSVKFVVFIDGHPRYPAALGRKRITRAG
jgi:hypothetical protein